MQLRYNFRLDPTPGQRMALARVFGCARVVYNDALRLRRDAYQAGEPRLSGAALQKAVITEAKRTQARAWLGEVGVDPLIQAVRDLEGAYGNFFASLSGRRKGPRVAEPRFKSRKDNRQAVRFTRNGFRLRGNGALYVAKIGEVRVRWSRSLPSEPSSVTVVKDACGRYFASFVVETDPAADLARFPFDPDAVYAQTGIDLGLTHFAVLSDGKKIDAPRFLRRADRKLAKHQKSLARKQKGSNNRKKAVVKVAAAHARVADSRRDFQHKLSTTIIRETQAVYVEDLSVAGLGRTRLAKSVHDAGWSGFVDMLEYKAARYGRYFARIDRFAPTSQTCSACGVKDGPKPLSVRQWTCAGCGTRHDRDINAARNVLAAGQADRVNACRAQVRPGRVPAQRREAGTHRGDLSSAQCQSALAAPSGAVGIPALQGREGVNSLSLPRR
jgi:putative transposase